MKRLATILTVVGTLALTADVAGAAGAAGVVGPKPNSGYGWWPGGYGYPPVTVPASGYPCSVTAYGPTFRSRASVWTQAYGGGTSCAGGVGVKTLTVVDQIRSPAGHWLTIAGSGVAVGPAKGNPLHAIRSRAAVLGHVYRVVALARLVVPNGHAGCSLTDTCSQVLTITATSRPLAP